MRLDGWAICAVALVGCWGDTPSGEDRRVGPSPLVSGSPLADVSLSCDEGTERDVALDEVTAAGFSAEDVLANVEGTHEDVIRWTTPEGLTVGPETGERTLRVSIERRGERAREFDPTTDVIGHGAFCQFWVIVDVTVTLRSEDGALNDRFAGELYAKDPRLAYLRAESTELALAGELSVSRDEEQAKLVSETFELSMTLSEHGATGTLNAVWATLNVEQMLIWNERFQVAEFGDASCDIEAYSLPLDERVELWEQSVASGQATIDSFNATTSVTVDWASGGSTTASLHFTPDRDGACVRVYVDSDSSVQDIEVPGVLDLQSDDGRVDARWPGTLEATMADEDGNVSGTWFVLAIPVTDVSNPTPADLGFPLASGNGLDLFSAMYDVAFEGGVPSGSITLFGYQDFNTVCELPDDPECNFSSMSLEMGTLR